MSDLYDGIHPDGWEELSDSNPPTNTTNDGETVSLPVGDLPRLPEQSAPQEVPSIDAILDTYYFEIIDKTTLAPKATTNPKQYKVEGE